MVSVCCGCIKGKVGIGGFGNEGGLDGANGGESSGSDVGNKAGSQLAVVTSFENRASQKYDGSLYDLNRKCQVSAFSRRKYFFLFHDDTEIESTTELLFF